MQWYTYVGGIPLKHRICVAVNFGVLNFWSLFFDTKIKFFELLNQWLSAPVNIFTHLKPQNNFELNATNLAHINNV